MALSIEYIVWLLIGQKLRYILVTLCYYFYMIFPFMLVNRYCISSNRCHFNCTHRLKQVEWKQLIVTVNMSSDRGRKYATLERNRAHPHVVSSRHLLIYTLYYCLCVSSFPHIVTIYYQSDDTLHHLYLSGAFLSLYSQKKLLATQKTSWYTWDVDKGISFVLLVGVPSHKLWQRGIP